MLRPERSWRPALSQSPTDALRNVVAPVCCITQLTKVAHHAYVVVDCEVPTAAPYELARDDPSSVPISATAVLTMSAVVTAYAGVPVNEVVSVATATAATRVRRERRTACKSISWSPLGTRGGTRRDARRRFPPYRPARVFGGQCHSPSSAAARCRGGRHRSGGTAVL